MFFFTSLKISYVLEPNLLEISAPTPKDSKEETTQRLKREEHELLCRGHIMNTFSDCLYNLFILIKSPREN